MAAKRHHYVPRVLLRRFSPDPSADNPKFFRFDKENGRSYASSVENEAVIRGYNTLEGFPDEDPLLVESLFSEVEANAKGPIERLVQGEPLLEDDFSHLAPFVWLQHVRTPLGRAQRRAVKEYIENLNLLMAVGDPNAAEDYVKELADGTSVEEVRQWQRILIDGIKRGEIGVELTKDHEILYQLEDLDLAMDNVFSQLSWHGIRPTGEARFILADHPVAFIDKFSEPDMPVSWLSSPTVEITIPLDPEFCLLLLRGEPRYKVLEVDDSRVNEVNLRSYAWAHWNIYGRSHAEVRGVHALAASNKESVALFKPRAMHFITINQVKGGPSLGVDFTMSPARGNQSRRKQD